MSETGWDDYTADTTSVTEETTSVTEDGAVTSDLDSASIAQDWSDWNAASADVDRLGGQL